MDDEGSNGDDFITQNLCLAYRKHFEDQVDNMEKSISSTIKIVGTVTALALAVLQLALHYLA